MSDFKLRPAAPADVPAIVGLIRELAEFEHLTHLLEVTPEALHPHLFGDRPVAEALVAEWAGDASSSPGLVAFALCFTNFSTGSVSHPRSCITARSSLGRSRPVAHAEAKASRAM